MTIDELKAHVRTMLNGAFPTVTIQFERIGDDPFHIGVAVYGVEPNAIKWVKGKILDIDEKICADSEFALTPLVRDVVTTERFYPEFASAWKVSNVSSCITFSHREVLGIGMTGLSDVLTENLSEWEYPKSDSANAANQELALAA